MKKRITSFLLALVLVFPLTGTAFAEGETGPTVASKGSNVTAALDGEKVNLTVSGLDAGQQYLILMVSGVHDSVESAEITASSIRYINQMAAANGQLDLSGQNAVYPDRLEDSTILVSGGSKGLQVVATVSGAPKPDFVKGDVNGDKLVDGQDAILFNQYLAKMITLEGSAFAAADIDGNGDVNGQDIIVFNQFLAKMITVWPNH